MPAVIFDLDGVVVYTTDQHRQAWQQAMAEQGYSLSNDEFCRVFGMRNEEILQQLLGKDIPSERVRAIIERKEMLYCDLIRRSLAPAPGLMVLLADLRANGFRLAFGTSASPPHG